jgi:hypothetical protein
MREVFTMNKKLLVLFVLLIVVFGIYGAYYLYAENTLVPEDLKVFKSDLKKMTDQPDTYNESKINLEESKMAEMENGPSLTIIPKNQRHIMANKMREQKNNSTTDEIKQNFTREYNRASKYDLLLKGNIANEIRSAYDKNMINLLDEINKNNDKMANDFENGDNKAYVNDLRNVYELSKKLHTYLVNSNIQLKNIVNQLNS